MPYTTIVAGTTITSSWANANVRDQVVTPFATTAARDSAISSPLAGMVVAITSNDSAEGLLTRTSANTWRPPWNISWGRIGHASTSTMQTGIGTGAVDITQLSVAYTHVANRLLRITTYLTLITGTSASFPQILIRDVLNATHATAFPTGSTTPPGATTIPGNAIGIYTGGAGANTLKTSVNFSVNANNQAGGASATDLAHIIVEDCGPTGAPT